jgi:phosphoribosylaminoimidazole carboxylase (NCAIR synthetase)
MVDVLTFEIELVNLEALENLKVKASKIISSQNLEEQIWE